MTQLFKMVFIKEIMFTKPVMIKLLILLIIFINYNITSSITNNSINNALPKIVTVLVSVIVTGSVTTNLYLIPNPSVILSYRIAFLNVFIVRWVLVPLEKS